MATNEILRFAETDTGTNLLTQAEYLADSQRPIGNQPGVARSKLVNKALRQASLIAAGLAEYIADNQSNNVTDALTPQNIADYLQAALTGALGVTPPQFDNDTSLATTAFVQRALGNVAETLSISTTQALNASHAGKVINTFGAGTITITLPAGSSLANGSVIEFFSTAPNVTIQRAGTDVIFTKSSPSVNSLVIGNGDTAKFVWLAVAGWLAVGGSVQLGSSNSFGASLASNGYQKLPSGLIIQWQQIGTINTTATPITFPIAFPNQLSAGGVLPTPSSVSASVSQVSGTVSKTGVSLIASVTCATSAIWVGY